MTWLDDTWQWFEKTIFMPHETRVIVDRINSFKTIVELDAYWNTLTPAQQSSPLLQNEKQWKTMNLQPPSPDPIALFIQGKLNDWVAYTETFQGVNRDNAAEKISEMSAKVIELFGAAAGIDMGLAAIPTTTLGNTSAAHTTEWVKWLGWGAVLAAVAHDPVKIGILRPYSDALETRFHNRRPEWRDMLKAYQQRSLSQTVITNITQITDSLMDQIEAENSTNLNDYGATWGYDQKWINIMKDAETRALSFGNLASMARIGQYNRKLSIFSLWTYGLDRRLMYPALSALETMRDVGLWKGFRSMVEPSYVQGLIDETDLRTYWDKILVPADVQDWAFLRLTKSRERYAAKEAATGLNKQRDLTRSDFAKAYLEGIIDLATFQAKLTQLGYDPDEISVIVKLTDNSKKLPAATKCKHLSLAEYELAHKNGLLNTDQVIARLQGEYCDPDIEIYRQILALEDLTAEAPIRERDLSVAELTTAYVDGIMTRDRMIQLLTKIGYDAEESGYLAQVADIKKELADAKKKRDDELAQAKATKDALAAQRAGLKRLPLSDYEKAWQHGLITEDELLARMQGEYNPYDIGLEKMMMAAGIARKG